MKKALVGVYETYEKAILGLQKLQESGIPVKQLSIVGKAYLGNNHVHVRPNDTTEKAEVSIATIAGGVLGILANFGIIAIPGLGLLYGSGAMLGVMAGVESGFIVGGVAAIFSTALGIDEAIAARYEKHLNENKFLVMAQGNKKQITLAHKILHSQALSLELNLN